MDQVNSGQGWAEGGPNVEEMDLNQAKVEIRQIERDPRFSGNADMEYWSRQTMLRRRDALYRRAAALDSNFAKADPAEAIGQLGIIDELRKSGITPELLKQKREELDKQIEDEAFEEEKRTALMMLRGEWGGDFEKNLKIAQEAFAVLPEETQIRLEELGLANHPEFVKILLRGGQMVEEYLKQAEAQTR